MPKCHVYPEAKMRVGKDPHGRPLIHHAPLIHVQTYTLAELDEEKRDGHDLPPLDGVGGVRALPDRLRQAAPSRPDAVRKAADYLEAAAELWPAYNFEDEIRYWRVRAEGKRMCHACHEVLPPAPGLRLRVPSGAYGGSGFAAIGSCVVPSLRPVLGVTAPAPEPLPAQAEAPEDPFAVVTHGEDVPATGFDPVSRTSTDTATENDDGPPF